MVLIKGFKGTTIWKAFFLNSLASSIIIVFAITINQFLGKFIIEDDDYIDSHKRIYKNKINFINIVITFFITFFITFISYTFLYYLFGFGGSFLVKP